MDEPEKEEIQRQLIDLYAFEKKRGPRVRDNAAKASDAVGRAIKRLHQHLAKSLNPDGTPNSVLRSFAEYINRHILIPSGRANGHGGLRQTKGNGGFFTYESPLELHWSP